MTTVACDGRCMAGDSQGTINDTIASTHIQKVFKLRDGSLIGFSGVIQNFSSIIKYFNGRWPFRRWPYLYGSIEILLLKKDGSLYSVDDVGRHLRVQPPYSIGSGYQFALGAMHAGSTPEEAVRIACELDVGSSGDITVLQI